MTFPTDFIHELRKHFTGDIRPDLASRVLYSTDASIYQIEPKGVAIPRIQEDLQAAVELAAKYRMPMLPRGAGTSLAGQAIGDALILDCSRWLDRIVEINPEDHYAIVEPGVVLANLNRAAATKGLQYGPDPASADRATMGGVIANNATGAHSLVYGMTADHLISADVIMADGSLATLGDPGTLDNLLVSQVRSSVLQIRQKYTNAITKNWPITWRNSAGYRLNYLLPWSPSRPSQWEGGYPPLDPLQINLAPLLAGSEGTLAVIRRAKINLVPKPKLTILSVLAYQSIAEACDDVPRLLTHHPTAVELIPRFIIQQGRSMPAYAPQMGWVVGEPAALLVVEFGGDQALALGEAARKVGDILAIAESPEDQARVWNVRKVGLGLLDSRPSSARPVAFIEDCAIPVQKLGEFVREVERILSAHGTEGGIYAHASAGCLHIRPILDLKTRRGVADLRAIAEAVLSLTLSLGGAMSSEHGDGLARSEFLERTYGPDLIEAMRMLKRAADPDQLLNPGKILDAPKMDMNLRYDIDYQARAWDSKLSFKLNGGLSRAIEQCNGQGLCRKDSGVMCPSYQATREEMHSTRGRANLLRAMISSPTSLRGEWRREASKSRRSNLLSPEDIASSWRQGAAPRNDIFQSVAQALDLCLACKGCKAECPSGVDMAKLKFAFQEQYYKTHRRQLRDYIFGYFHIAAGLASAVAPVSNAMMEIPLIRKLVARVLGITPHRPFPKFSRRHARILTTATPSHGEKVVLLSDPFARYVEPETEQAALHILSHCGFEIHVLPILGAGASLLSKGFVDAARRHAARVLEALDRVDPAREAPIVGIEPPEIYTLKHDYIDLLPEREAEINRLTSRVWLLDEFLLRSNAFHKLRVAMLGGQNSINKQSPKKNEIPSSKPSGAVSRNDSGKIRFHPHCHQRAEGLAADGLPLGANATVELLRSCGYEVELLETGCCGMAGTFGYEAEHYELSMKVGELKLFPALTPTTLSGTSPKYDMENSYETQSSTAVFGGLRSVPEGQREGVVSSGAACRMQIKQGTGIDSRHPVVLIADLIKEPTG